jgi:hypothetical protein
VHASIVDARESRIGGLRHQAPSPPLRPRDLIVARNHLDEQASPQPRHHPYAQDTASTTFIMAGFGPHNPPGAPRPSPAAQCLAKLIRSQPSTWTRPSSNGTVRYPAIPTDSSLTRPRRLGADRCIRPRWTLTLTMDRDDGQPTQVLPLDAPDRLDHVRIRRRCAGSPWYCWIHD